MNKSNDISTAFVLGAGLGTRLRPLTEKMPKPLLPVGGRPIITSALEHLLTIGIKRFIINTHHLPEKYDQTFPQGSWQGLPIVLRHEPTLLDTAGGIKNIEDLLAGEKRLIIYNGDILTNLPLAALLAGHFARKTEVTLALRSFGGLQNVCIDGAGYICDLRDTLKQPGVKRCVFSGIYIMETSFLQRISPGKIESIILPLIASIKENPFSIGGVLLDEGYWHDLGTLEEYYKLQKQGP